MNQLPDLRALAAQAWHDVLRCDRPSDEDDFFELGGHSLAGARVMTRIQRHVPNRLSVRVLFDHPVFHDFVAALATAAR